MYRENIQNTIKGFGIMKVMVAEDDVISRRALVRSVEDLGYEVVESRDGEEAWHTLLTEQPDPRTEENGIRMAILDWQMPRMNGIELCRRIREKSIIDKQIYIYVILLSGRDGQEDILEGLSAGADDYMLKPFDSADLRIRLENGERIIQTKEKKEDLIHIDETTGIWNREKILGFLREELDRGSRLEMSVGTILVEIDHFQEVTKNREQSEVDFILKNLASQFKNAMRKYDKLGIFTRSQFLGVFPNCRKDHIILIGERFRRLAHQVITPTGQNLTISVGCLSSDHFPDCADQALIASSSKALSSAKNEGGDQVFYAQSD